jgi:hypothetical protein
MEKARLRRIERQVGAGKGPVKLTFRYRQPGEKIGDDPNSVYLIWENEPGPDLGQPRDKSPEVPANLEELTDEQLEDEIEEIERAIEADTR